MPTRWVRSPTNLLAALLVMAGLALSVPASCWCAVGDHAGMLIHPIFPHHHGDALADEYDDSVSAASASDAPLLGISAPAPATDALGLAGGDAVLPALLALMMLSARRLRASGLAPPDQHLAGPITPPPRPVPAAC